MELTELHEYLELLTLNVYAEIAVFIILVMYRKTRSKPTSLHLILHHLLLFNRGIGWK